MRVNVMAGLCLIILGVVNVLHEVTVVSNGRGQPGVAYALVTAAFFTAGAALLCSRQIKKTLAAARTTKRE